MNRRSVEVMLLGLVLAVSGCLLPRAESQPVHTYQLNPDGGYVEAGSQDPNGPVLLVNVTQSEPGFDTPRMAYLSRPYELRYYATHQWADTPARLFSPLLVHAVSRSGAWRAVLPWPNSARGDYRLDSQGFTVQQEFLQQPSHVRFRVWMQLVELKESRVISTRMFEVTEGAPSEDAYGCVLAANRAAAAILDQVALWLEGCARHLPECRR